MCLKMVADGEHGDAVQSEPDGVRLLRHQRRDAHRPSEERRRLGRRQHHALQHPLLRRRQLPARSLPINYLLYYIY